VNQEPDSVVGTRPYVVVCYLSLAAVFLAQFQQGILVVGLPAIALGILGVVFRRRQTPIVFLILIAVAQLVHQFVLHRFRGTSRFRFLEVEDVVLCVGVLGFLAAHYRLQAIWSHVLTPDPRRRVASQRRNWFFRRSRVIALEPRPERQVTQDEITMLAISLPAWALVAQGMLALLAPSWDVLELPLRFARMLLVLWLLVIGLFVVRTALGIWRRARMDRQTARLLLQDVYWQELRGEQRRIHRWLVWTRRKNQARDGGTG
jgi:hypothetical protein